MDARYRTIADRESRAITGKSSGGFGAMITPMLRPDLFGALATHAGDTLYELCYVPEFGEAARHLRDYDDDIFARWWDDFRSRARVHQAGGRVLLMVLGVRRCFSADAGRDVELPFDPRTGRAARRGLAALAGLGPGPDGRRATPTRCARCGRSGSTPARATSTSSTSAREAFREELGAIGVPDDRVTSSCSTPRTAAIDYRYPIALAWLAQRLAR